MKKLLPLTLALIIALSLSAAALAADEPPVGQLSDAKRNVLPYDSDSFDYSFENSTVQYSDFVFSINEAAMAVHILFSPNGSTDHTVTADIVNSASNEVVHTFTATVNEGSESEYIFMTYQLDDNFSYENTYCIRLSDPSAADASGIVSVFSENSSGEEQQHTTITTFAAEPVPFDSETVLGGLPEGETLTRGQFALYLARALDNKGYEREIIPKTYFSDVPDDSEYYEAISYLRNLGIVRGNGEGLFYPDNVISYDEAVTMAVRAVTTADEEEAYLESYGGYPTAYFAYSAQYKLSLGVGGTLGRHITSGQARRLIENVWNHFSSYDLARPLGADYYNGELYIICGPESWQGLDMIYANGAKNGYYYKEGYYYNENVLPGWLSISRDGVNWETAYEDIDGERVYYMLPEDIPQVTKYRFNANSGYFESDIDSLNNWYSHDLVTWTKGRTPLSQHRYSRGDSVSAPMIDAGSRLSKYEDMEFYMEYHKCGDSIYSLGGRTQYSPQVDSLWFSKDGRTWINVTLPEELMFFEYVTFVCDDRILITGCADFSDEENALLEQEAADAAALGLIYERPPYKEVTYYISTAELDALLG